MNTGLYFSVHMGDLSGSALAVVDFILEEALSEFFTLTLKVSSTDPDIDLQDQLLRKAALSCMPTGKTAYR